MQTDQNELEVVEGIVEVPKKRTGFLPGHKKVGGRKAGLPTKRQLFDATCQKMKFSPVEFVIHCVKFGVTPETPGQPSKPVSQSDRCRLSETLLSFAAPRLSATTTELTGRNGGPLELASVDVVELMRNPAMASAAQTLALGMSTATREARRGITSGTHDVVIEAETES